MDWNSLLLGLLGTTTLGGIWGAIVFYRENKKLKQNEVKNSNTESQSQQIDLGVKYQEQMLDLIDKVRQKQDSSAENQQKMLEMVHKIDERQDKTENQLANIVNYLNGDYQDFLRRQFAPKPKPRKK